jgi:hypothetical protein
MVKFINSKRQPRSLKRILCKSNFNDNNSYTVAKYQDLRCGTCQYITEGSTYNFNGKLFKVNADMSCSTRNVLYGITYLGCKEYYIGETSNPLRTRVRVHKQQINNQEYSQIPLSEHIDRCGSKQFKIFPFYKFSGGSDIPISLAELSFVSLSCECMSRW